MISVGAVFIDETESTRRMYETAENSRERESADRPILNIDTQGNSENNAPCSSAPQSGDTANQELFDIDIEALLGGYTFEELMRAIGDQSPSFVDRVWYMYQ